MRIQGWISSSAYLNLITYVVLVSGPKASWEVFLGTSPEKVQSPLCTSYPAPYPKPPQPKSFPFPSISTYINLSFWPRGPFIFCSWPLGLCLLSRLICPLPSSLSLLLLSCLSVWWPSSAYFFLFLLWIPPDVSDCFLSLLPTIKFFSSTIRRNGHVHVLIFIQ